MNCYLYFQKKKTRKQTQNPLREDEVGENNTTENETSPNNTPQKSKTGITLQSADLPLSDLHQGNIEIFHNNKPIDDMSNIDLSTKDKSINQVTVINMIVNHKRLDPLTQQLMAYNSPKKTVSTESPSDMSKNNMPYDRPAGQRLAGQKPAGQRPAGQRLTGQRLTGQRLAGQSLAGQSLAGQSPAGQRLAGQRPAGQSLAGQDLLSTAVDVIQIPRSSYVSKGNIPVVPSLRSNKDKRSFRKEVSKGNTPVVPSLCSNKDIMSLRKEVIQVRVPKINLSDMKTENNIAVSNIPEINVSSVNPMEFDDSQMQLYEVEELDDFEDTDLASVAETANGSNNVKHRNPPIHCKTFDEAMKLQKDFEIRTGTRYVSGNVEKNFGNCGKRLCIHYFLFGQWDLWLSLKEAL